MVAAHFLGGRIYENLRGWWESHTYHLSDIQVTFSEDSSAPVGHPDSEANGLRPLLAAFILACRGKYGKEKNDQMFPRLWKEEHVFYLKRSSHWIAPSS